MQFLLNALSIINRQTRQIFDFTVWVNIKKFSTAVAEEDTNGAAKSTVVTVNNIMNVQNSYKSSDG